MQTEEEGAQLQLAGPCQEGAPEVGDAVGKMADQSVDIGQVA